MHKRMVISLNISQIKMCTEEARGYIDKIIEDPKTDKVKIEVTYEVEGVEFKITEKVAHRLEIVHCGNEVLGTKKIPLLGELKQGKEVLVKYNPEKPDKAYLPQNKFV